MDANNYGLQPSFEGAGGVLITGATSGIGLATAIYLTEKGYKVYGTYRQTSNTAELDAAIEKCHGLLEKILMDVAQAESVHSAINEILLRAKIDVVINNAGYAMTGTVETTSVEKQKEMFDTNLFGAINVIQAVLPHFRARAQGQIVNIGSVVDIAPFGAIEMYSVSKYALRGLSESMAVTLSPFNIKVSHFQPGSVKTPAAIKQQVGTRDLGRDNPYALHEVGQRMCLENLANGAPPEKAAKAIYAILQEANPKLCYPFGEFAENLAASRYRDPSGSRIVAAQIQNLTACGLLPARNEVGSLLATPVSILQAPPLHITRGLPSCAFLIEAWSSEPLTAALIGTDVGAALAPPEEDISLIATEAENLIVGQCSLNHTSMYWGQLETLDFDSQNTATKTFIKIHRKAVLVEKEYLQKRHKLVEDSLHSAGIAVLPKRRGKNIGCFMREKQIELCRNLGATTLFCETTNRFSAALVEKAKFVKIAEFPYAQLAEELHDPRLKAVHDLFCVWCLEL